MSMLSSTWQLCPHFVLRRAGFPLDWLASLSLESAVPALVAVEEADALVRDSLDGWRSIVRPKLVEVVNARVDDDRALRTLKRVNKVAKRAALPTSEDVALLAALVPEVDPWARTFASRLAGRLRAREAWFVAFDADFTNVRKRLETLAQHPRFREALFLLNGDFEQRAAALDADAKRSSHVRRREQAVFSYLQRLCAKNESNSFFGPVHYGRIVSAGTAPPLAFDPSFDGASPKRTAFLSHWLIDDLVKKISSDPRLADCVPVVSIPAKRRASELAWPDRGRSTLALAGDWRLSINEARSRVAEAIARGEWERKIPIPPSEVHPLTTLMRAIAALPTPDDAAKNAVAEWTEILGAFERDSHRFASTDEVKSKRAIQVSIEDRYRDLTGGEVKRNQGRMFRTRGVIYEDAWVDRGFGLAEDASAKLLAALAPVLEIGADFTRLVRARMNAEARAVMETWFGSAKEIPYERFIAAWHAQGEKPRSSSAAALARIAELDARLQAFEELWAEALAAFERGDAPDAIVRRSRSSVDDLPRVGPHVLSPDILPMKNDGRGPVDWVLGEIHHGVTMDGWMMSFHPEADVVRSLIREELSVVAADAGATPANLVMGRHSKVAPPEYSGISVEWSGYARDRSQTRAVRDLVVHDDGRELALKEREGAGRLAFYPPGFGFNPRGYLPFEIFSLPIMRLPARRGEGALPRASSAGLVIARAEWRLDSSAFASLTDAESLAQAMLCARELRRVHGMPRFLFVRPEGEPKPIYLDWQSPLAVELLIAHVRKGVRLAFSEMLPGPEELVLRGARGAYTSELRFMVTEHA